SSTGGQAGRGPLTRTPSTSTRALSNLTRRPGPEPEGPPRAARVGARLGAPGGAARRAERAAWLRRGAARLSIRWVDRRRVCDEAGRVPERDLRRSATSRQLVLGTLFQRSGAPRIRIYARRRLLLRLGARRGSLQPRSRQGRAFDLRGQARELR